jgi:hypothetical protein
MAKARKVKKTAAHPGFRAVQSEIAAGITPRRKGQTRQEAAGAILGASTRGASAAAKRRNPRLRRVRGA